MLSCPVPYEFSIGSRRSKDTSQPQHTARTLNRENVLVLALLLLLLAVSSVPSLVWRTLWYDELLQFYVSSLGSAGQVMHALANSPPTTDPALSYLLSHFSMRLLGQSAMAFRLPSFIGYLVGIVSFFFFLTRRFGPICAGLAITGLYVGGINYYASEGRPYGLVIGACGLSLLAWQKCREYKSRWWLAVLAIALAIGFNSHYFAILLGLPILVAEAYCGIRERRPDWRLIGTVFLSYASCVFWIPFWNAAFEFRPVIGNRIGAFEASFGVYAELLAAWYLAFVLVLAISDCFFASPRTSDENEPPVPELLAMASLVLLPFFGYALAKFGSGLFIPRYTLATAIGCVGIVAALLFRTAHRNPMILYSAFYAMVLIVMGHGVLQAKWIHGDRARLALRTEHLLEGPAPIVLDDPYLFLPAFHYARPELRRKLLCPLDQNVTMHRIGSATMVLSLRSLSRLKAFSGVFCSLGSLKDDGKPFEVVETPDHSHAWVLPEFLSSGWTVELERTDGADRLYSVTVADNPFGRR